MATILFLFSLYRGCSFVHGRQKRINDANTVKWHTHAPTTDTKSSFIFMHFSYLTLDDTSIPSPIEFLRCTESGQYIGWSRCQVVTIAVNIVAAIPIWVIIEIILWLMIPTNDVADRHRKNELFSTHFHTRDSFILNFPSWCSAVSLAIYR